MEPIYPIGLSQARGLQRRQKCTDDQSQENPQSTVGQISEAGASKADARESECSSPEDHLQRQAPQPSAFGESNGARDQLDKTNTVELELIIEKAVAAAVRKMQEILFQVTKECLEVLNETDAARPSEQRNQKGQTVRKGGQHSKK